MLVTVVENLGLISSDDYGKSWYETQDIDPDANNVPLSSKANA